MNNATPNSTEPSCLTLVIDINLVFIVCSLCQLFARMTVISPPGIVQQYITLRILAPPHMFSLHNDDFISSAVRVLHLLYTSNEQMTRGKLEYPEFYNDAINESIDLKAS